MSGITEIEKLKLENIFSMGGGYVLDFSNQSYQSFIFNTIRVDIYHSKYEKYGTSKAKRLKALWEMECDVTVGKLTEGMLLYYEAQITINNQNSNLNKKLFDECLLIAYRLQGKKLTNNRTEITVEDFLKMEVDEVPISFIAIDSSVITVIEQRIIEVKKCLKSEASLSVIFLCGSILEGVLLGIASKKSKEFNQSPISPKDKETGKVKPFHEWTLSNFIDVAYDLKLLGLDVKKFSHSLRDFRNYIHPYQQMNSGFNPDNHTAKISWQVLKAALNDLYNKI
jgi:hypothetical protein